MLKREQEGFVYQSSSPYMLAYYVNKVFENDDLALSLSGKSLIKANIKHDINSNLNKIIYIYASIIGEDKKSFHNLYTIKSIIPAIVNYNHFDTNEMVSVCC